MKDNTGILSTIDGLETGQPIPNCRLFVGERDMQEWKTPQLALAQRLGSGGRRCCRDVVDRPAFSGPASSLLVLARRALRFIRFPNPQVFLVEELTSQVFLGLVLAGEWGD
jgi:hypothetical protein